MKRPFGSEDRRAADTFWPEFAGHVWEQRAISVDGSPFAPPCTSAALFDTVVRACRSTLYRPRSIVDVFRHQVLKRPDGRARRIGVRFIVDDQGVGRTARGVLSSVVPRWALPREQDSDFEGYHARISAMLNPPWRRRLGLRPRTYALIVNNPEAVDFPLWRWTSRFLRGLYRQVGMNNGGTYYAAFIGDYPRTAFGVHHDPESVFSFPVVGRKTVRVWNDTYVRANPELRARVEYARFEKASEVRTANVGGFIYWPSRAWHVAEGDGALSVSLALGLQLHSAEEMGSDRCGPSKMLPFDPDDLLRSAQTIPQELLAARGRSAGEHWLGLVSAMGCLFPPEPRTAALDSELPMACTSPILRVALPGDRLLVAVNGQIIRLANGAAFQRLLHELEGGPGWTTASIFEAHSQSIGRAELGEFLGFLYGGRGCEAAAGHVVDSDCGVDGLCGS